MNKLSDKEITHLINQDIPTDSEDGLDSDGDSFSNDLDYDLDWDNACKNVLNENDSDELTKLLQQFDEFDTPIDSSVIFNDPPDYDSNVTIDTEPSIPTTIDPPIIYVQFSRSSVTYNIFNSNFLTRSNRNQNQPQPPQSPINSNKKPIVVKNVKWSSGNLINIACNFQGNTNLSDEILELETPLQILKYFFTNDLIDHICSESLKYSVLNDISNSTQITPEDLQKFIGVLTLMSLVNITNVRHYLCPTLGNNLVQETMTVNKFEKIRQTIYFNDNYLNSMGPNRDKLFKIRPVIETLRKRFLTVPLEENLSVDEQLCSTKKCS